ncbi:hypothetical protein MedDCM-OCT-S15-C5-cds1, partial [uncultured Mediterranean phage MEDS5 group]
KKAGDRNEALDCFVYSYAALNFLYLRYNRHTIFEQFKKAAIKVEPKTERKVESEYQPLRRRGARRPQQSFVTSW